MQQCTRVPPMDHQPVSHGAERSFDLESNAKEWQRLADQNPSTNSVVIFGSPRFSLQQGPAHTVATNPPLSFQTHTPPPSLLIALQDDTRRLIALLSSKLQRASIESFGLIQ
ncbi:hypothetical protein IAQ61_006280 [Plenodomus lingam]|uniref:uncharacterized protein n=1 Tax=Leptosphaeria maculans TaxID=5022 RepID=UPI003330B33B|nr:hypothetical protein IAQ61_006280 [Plenodomus lingam]